MIMNFSVLYFAYSFRKVSVNWSDLLPLLQVKCDPRRQAQQSLARFIIDVVACRTSPTPQLNRPTKITIFYLIIFLHCWIHDEEEKKHSVVVWHISIWYEVRPNRREVRQNTATWEAHPSNTGKARLTDDHESRVFHVHSFFVCVAFEKEKKMK